MPIRGTEVRLAGVAWWVVVQLQLLQWVPLQSALKERRRTDNALQSCRCPGLRRDGSVQNVDAVGCLGVRGDAPFAPAARGRCVWRAWDARRVFSPHFFNGHSAGHGGDDESTSCALHEAMLASTCGVYA